MSIWKCHILNLTYNEKTGNINKTVLPSIKSVKILISFPLPKVGKKEENAHSLALLVKL